jgi:hypothetical protein
MTNSNSKTTRRGFLGKCAAMAAGATLAPWALGFAEDKEAKTQFLALREDPVRKLFAGKTPDLERILALYPRTTGRPAFDSKEIAANLARLKTTPEVDTGYPFLDLSIKTGLAYIDATFEGDHPKYGVDFYAGIQHDGFPPTVISAVDALTAWGMNERADQIFSYWLSHYVKGDSGQFNYYGPSIAEYGQMLDVAANFVERAGTDFIWYRRWFSQVDKVAGYLLRCQEAAASADGDGLISGSPEADEADKRAKYFHNNGWVVKGLNRWADLCEKAAAKPINSPGKARKAAAILKRDTLGAIEKRWPKDRADWWLAPLVEPMGRPSCMTGSREASYTNYRYWPELLSSGILSDEQAGRVVDARLTAGGQFCGMTRFEGHLDDWPLYDYLYGVWQLGRKDDFLLSLFGHIAYHQAEGHLTAYEQISFPPGRRVADYCLPCQLAARVGRLINKS